MVEAVFRALQPLCDDLRYDVEPTLLATANVWHLSTRFRGTLRDPAVSSLDLVRGAASDPRGLRRSSGRGDADDPRA